MASLIYHDPDSLIAIPNGLDPTIHDSLVGTIIRLNVGFIATIAIIIALRVCVRTRILHRVWSDDIFAGLSTIALSAMCIVSTRFGLGRHELDLNPATVINASKTIVKNLFVCQVLYATAVTITKTSIIASYLRIFPTHLFRRVMYVTAAIIVALWICSLFVTIFQCNPIRGAWDFTLQKKKCIGILNYFYFASSVNIATDLILCTSPLPLLWTLNVARNERIILCVLFGFGLFATAASAVRVSQLHNLKSFDLSYACVSSLNWSVVEVATGIICASLPSLKPIIMHLFPGKLFSVQRGSTWRTPRNGSSAVSAVGRDGNGHEMGSSLQRGSTFHGSRLERKPQSTTRTNTMSSGKHDSDEESLVCETPTRNGI